MKLKRMGAFLLILCIVSTMLPTIAMAEETGITYTTIAPNTWYTISGKNGEDCYYRYETDESGYGIYTLWIEGATEKNHRTGTNGCPQFGLSDSSSIDLCIVPTSDEARFRLMKVKPASSIIITGVPATVLTSIRENGKNADFTGIEFEVTYRDGSKQPHTYNATYTWQTPWGTTNIYYLDYDGNFYVPRYDESNHTLYINAYDFGDSAGIDSERYIIPDESVDEPEEKVKISEGLSKVTGDLENTEFNTIEKIRNKLTETVVLNEGYTAENTVLYDIELVISNDGGLTWVPATAENFSKEGIVVTIPYPDGTNAEDYDFTVAHMFDEEVNGHKTGEVETPLVTKGANSISFRLMGTSPVIVGYKKVVEEHTHSYGEWMDCGDNANHQRTCSCGYVQKEAHVWDDGKITAEGAKTYTCTTCGAEMPDRVLPVITLQPENVTVNSGGTAKFSVAATGTGLTYQWQYQSAKNTTTWANSSAKTPGYNTPILSVEATEARNGYKYRCVITDGMGEEIITDVAVLTVTGSEPLSISKQPENKTAAVGTRAEFTVTAGGEGLKYQWQYQSANGTTWKNSSSATVGYNTETLSVEATEARNGYKYRCVITDRFGATVTSDAAVLSVKAAAPAITVSAQPQNFSNTAGNTAFFVVRASGEGLTYQWQYKTAKAGAQWQNCSAATVGFDTMVLEVSMEAKRNGYSYRCILTDANGNTVTSASAKLTVK